MKAAKKILALAALAFLIALIDYSTPQPSAIITKQSLIAYNNITFFNFTNLSKISEDEFYTFKFSVGINYSTNLFFAMVINGDNVCSNYTIDYIEGNGTIITGNRANLNVWNGLLSFENDASGELQIKKSPIGFVRSTGLVNRYTPNGIDTFYIAHSTNFKVNNIDNITIYTHYGNCVPIQNGILKNSSVVLIKE